MIQDVIFRQGNCGKVTLSYMLQSIIHTASLHSTVKDKRTHIGGNMASHSFFLDFVGAVEQYSFRENYISPLLPSGVYFRVQVIDTISDQYLANYLCFCDRNPIRQNQKII